MNVGYYDDNEDFIELFDEVEDPIDAVVEEFSERIISSALVDAGFAPNKIPKYSGNMEKFIFGYGNENEVYTSEEIKYIESVHQILVYDEFYKKIRQKDVPCRAFSAHITTKGMNALSSCVFFEKIINKAFDGFNVFMFVTEDCVFFGCRMFEKKAKYDCTLSVPVYKASTYDQYIELLSNAVKFEDFIDYYTSVRNTITNDHIGYNDIENEILKKRGVHSTYLNDLRDVEDLLGIDMFYEKRRYRGYFEDEDEDEGLEYSSVLEGVLESLDYIKSKRVNTYELLYDAEETYRLAQESGSEYENTDEYEDIHDRLGIEGDSEIMNDPEKMINYLKKLKGL